MQVQITCAGAEAVSEDARAWALPGRGRQGGGGRVEVQTRSVEEEDEDDDAMELSIYVKGCVVLSKCKI